MAVDKEPYSEVTAETKINEIDGDYKTCFMTVEFERNGPPDREAATRTTGERWVPDSGCLYFMTPFL